MAVRLLHGISLPDCPQIPTFLQQQLRGRGSAQDSSCRFPRLPARLCFSHSFFCLKEAFIEATQHGLLTVFLATQGFKILQMDQNPCYFDL